ncbi:hypothetical protein PV08_01575 [Exophiala spinifera]|uniref:Zn(2)-C6 fungal-type domain-containing protein n=1 Tax=Exophiala spinifera TaxID=91928 RepID=A0A0D1Z0B3_9EURO|nr:uncharacterized protein PV08_01575 [Exophiala spinifera]KIW20996.1 hypothetical protein PV08_01575 [Exophiala spinifera]
MEIATETPGWVPISQWPTLEDLCHGFDENLLAPSDKLTNKQFDLVFSGNTHIEHKFHGNKVAWRITKGAEGVGISGEAEYRAFEVRPKIFFIDFYKPEYEEEVSIVMNIEKGQTVVAISGFREVDGVKRTYTKFSDARLEGYDGSQPYKMTDELIGKHILYRYTGTDVYEHVYLNQGTFTWHCLGGTEKGLADTEPCKMLKLDERLYLLFWTEKIMPVESVVVIDLERMRSTGRFFCWDPKPAKYVHTLFGSYATILADTGSRLKRVKCDETTPSCKQCNKRGLQCPGYNKPLKWSDKHERVTDRHRSKTHDPSAHFEQRESPQSYFRGEGGDVDLEELVKLAVDSDYISSGCTSSVDILEVYLAPYHDKGNQSFEYTLDDTAPSKSAISIMQQNNTNNFSILSPSLVTQEDLLSGHYFSSVCVINSGFDSPANPFRAYVAELMCEDPTIYHCMLSMSAAHLYQHDQIFKEVALDYRTKAISSLRTNLSNISNQGDGIIGKQSQLTTLLFGTLLLGMSSTWHEVTSLGQTFLYGARSLLKSSKTISLGGKTSQDGSQFRNRSEANFLVGALAFWEMLASYHLDQDQSAVDYLEVFSEGIESEDSAPNPWTGVNTGLFLLAAKVGTVTRQVHTLRQLADALPVIKGETRWARDLLDTASCLERRIRSYEIRPAQRMRDTDDEQTPGTHFEIMARIYQLTLRLELYQAFPQLLDQDEHSCPQPRTVKGHPGILRALAINILALLSSIPVTSGTKAIQLFPLVVAGSALQYDSATRATTDGDRLCGAQEVLFLNNDDAITTYWRSIVRKSLSTVYRYVGLESAQCGTKIVEQVWTRSDARHDTGILQSVGGVSEFVYWADIMREQHLETLLG